MEPAQQAAVPWVELVIAFILAVYALHVYLDLRQLRAIRLPKPPAALAGLFTQQQYEQTQAYSLDKWWLGFWRDLYSQIETVAILHFRLWHWIWSAIPVWLPAIADWGEIPHTIAFILVVSLIGILTSLPWSAYSMFVVEARHGFNKTTPALFVTDTLKSAALGALLLPPLVAGFTALLQRAGPWAPLQLWAFVLALSLLAMAAYPSLIAPLFNKFEPLPGGALRSSIEDLAASLAFPLTRLYTMDGSKRSGHSNAFMYGFSWSKRIVLYDTLLSSCSNDQVVAVLAHELGHWRCSHTPIMFAVGQVHLLLSFALFAALRSTCASLGLYESFGWPPGERPAFIAYLLFTFLASPLDEVVGCLVNVVSRTFEFQADAFAVSLGRGKDLVAALLSLEQQNKAAMHVDPLYSAFHHSHPPLEARLDAVHEALKKTK